MVAAVQKHIAKSCAGLLRSPERARVVAVAENAASSIGEAIETSRDPDLERAQPPRERSRVLGLDDEVKVRVLKGEVDDAKVGALFVRGAQRRFHGMQLALRPERRELVCEAQGRVHRMTGDVRRPSAMRHARMFGARPTCALSRPTPPWMLGMRTTRCERELQGTSHHLVSGLYTRKRARVRITDGDYSPTRCVSVI
jgi:hypothetical protein